MGLNAIKIWPAIYSLRYYLAILIFMAVLLSPQFSSFAKAPLATAQSRDVSALNTLITRSDAEVFYLNAVNNLRLSHGLKPLLIDSRLNSSAYEKATDMVVKGYWGHFAPAGGLSFADFIWQKSPGAETVGENLAKCFDSREDAFKALVASPEHYAVMTSDFNDFGIAEKTDSNSGCVHTVMHFAKYK